MNFGILRTPYKTALLSFAPGAFASGTTVGGIAINCTRAGTAYYRDVSKAWQSASANQFRVGYTTNGLYGLIVEPSVTQLYPTPSAPASGTGTLTVTGTHTFWVEGTGSQQISAGTATCTGLPATASANNPVIFSCSVTGTVTFASVTGSLTKAQLEASTGPTSFIASGTRNADQITFTVPAFFKPNSYGIYAKAINLAPWNATIGNINSCPVSLGGYNNANSVTLWVGSNGSPAASVKDSSTLTSDTYSPSLGGVFYGGHDFAVTSRAGLFSFWVDGAAQGGNNTRLMGAAPTSGFIGVLAGGYSAIYIPEIFITTNPNYKDRGRAVPQVGMFGDSLTIGTGSAGYPDVIGQYAPGRYMFVNQGVSSNTISQIQTRYLAAVAGGYQTLTIMGGINDILADATGATIWSTYKAIVDDARSRGINVVAMTCTPWKNYSSWTSGRQTETVNLNNSITGYSPGSLYTSVDMYAAMTDGLDHLAASYDWGDGLHFNATGQAKVASTLWTAVNAALFT